jgi:oligopeptide transport system permease protein
MPSNITRPDQQHYVAPLEETPLVAIDKVKTEGKPTNL